MNHTNAEEPVANIQQFTIMQRQLNPEVKKTTHKITFLTSECSNAKNY